MAAKHAGRKGRPWRQVQAKVYAEETHCFLCGHWVNQNLANYRGRQARSVHHLIPPDIAPELANARENLRLAHLGCNSSYGRGEYKTPGQLRARRTSITRTHLPHTQTQLVTSRLW